MIDQLSASNEADLLDGLSIEEVNREQSAGTSKEINSEIDKLLSSSPPSSATNDETEFDPLKKSTPSSDTVERNVTHTVCVSNTQVTVDSSVQSNVLVKDNSDLKSSKPEQTANLLLDAAENESSNHDIPQGASKEQDILQLDATQPKPLANSHSFVETKAKMSILDVADEDMEPKEVENHLPDDLVSYPHSMEHIELVSDGVVRVTLCKVWKPDRLGVVFFVNNQSQTHAVNDLVLKLDLPSNFKVRELCLKVNVSV